MKRQCPHESFDRWKPLIDRKPLHIDLAKSIYLKSKKSKDDPFNCKDLVIPSTNKLVSRILEEKAKEWEDLDSQILMNDFESQTSKQYDENDAEEPLPENQNIENYSNTEKIMRKASGIHSPLREEYSYYSDIPERGKNLKIIDVYNEKEGEKVFCNNEFKFDISPLIGGDYGGINWGFHTNRIRLPDFFNYACRSHYSGVSSYTDFEPENCFKSQRKKRRQVMNLHDPTQSLDYEEELRKIFHSVPLERNIKIVTESEIENTTPVVARTLAIKNEIEEGWKDFTRLDGHALSRIRRKDRHHLPRLMTKHDPDRTMKNVKYPKTSSEKIGKTFHLSGINIRLECWKKGMKRGTAPDVHRLELECFGDQTLYDIHRTIIHASNDDLFLHGIRKMQCSKRNEEFEVPWHDDENVSYINIMDSDEAEASHSGIFLIEDTCYVTGNIDYASPVLQWLDEDINNTQVVSLKSRLPRKTVDKNLNSVLQKSRNRKKNRQISRRDYLHIPLAKNKVLVRKMEDTRLDSIPLRLNVRYVHACHGDFECAVFVSDIRVRLCDEELKREDYPLCHDVWTSSYPLVICEGCQRLPASLITMEDDLVDEGVAYLCFECYRLLHYRCVETLDIRKENIGKDRKLLIRKKDFRVYPLNILQDQQYLSMDCNELDALF